MDDRLGVIGTFLAKEHLALAETREITVESRSDPVRAYVPDAAPASAPDRAEMVEVFGEWVRPPSWDPLGVVPHLWDQVPDLPDTIAPEPEKSSSRVAVSRLDSAVLAAAPAVNFLGTLLVPGAAAAWLVAPLPLNVLGLAFLWFYGGLLFALFAFGFAFPRRSCVECSADLDVFDRLRRRPSSCDRCRSVAIFAALKAAARSRGCSRCTKPLLSSEIGVCRPCVLAERKPSESRIPPDLCDVCYAANVAVSSPRDVVLCVSCRRLCSQPGLYLCDAAARDRLIRSAAFRSIAADRKTGRSPVAHSAVESSKIGAGEIDGVKFSGFEL